MKERDVVAAAGLAVAVVGALYFWFGDLYFDLADESFLWYGVIHARAGEVPLRDFQAYDPGRYYWCVAWSFLFGQGVLGLRASLSVVQAVGLFLGLLVCRRVTRNFVELAFCGAILAAWMFPRHKLFEPAIAMAAVWVGVRLIEAPSARRLFETGAFTGLVAWFGRNHGLYCALAFASMIALLRARRQIQLDRRAVASFVLGGVAGSAPLWVMFIVIPGFGTAFLESISFNLTQGVNLPLPYPWPWSIDLSKRGFDLLAEISTIGAFALPLLLYPVGLVIALRTRHDELAARAPMVAAALVGAFFIHHASVRSDIWHLAQAIHPLLILALVIPACVSARPAARLTAFAAVGVATFFVALNTNPLFAQVRPGPRVVFVRHDVAGDLLRVPSSQAAQMTDIEAAIHSHVLPGESLFVAPARPGFYPIFGRKNPDWWLYFLWPAADAAQRQTIERLESAGVGWALIADDAIDGLDALRFRNSNAKVWEYLSRSFVAVDEPRLPPNHTLLRRRAP